jgi:hypothetical protein
MPLPVTVRGMLAVMSAETLMRVGPASSESESLEDDLDDELDCGLRGAGAGADCDEPDWDCVVCASAGKPNIARTARKITAFNRMEVFLSLVAKHQFYRT